VQSAAATAVTRLIGGTASDDTHGLRAFSTWTDNTFGTTDGL
jgi:hypothetical protein